MATYRHYKNGIYGHRYKGYYITRTEDNGKKVYSVVDADKKVLQSAASSARDCEWYIDKITASPETLGLIQALYSEELYKLSEYYGQLTEKQASEGLTGEETVIFEYVVKVRKRRAEGKPY